MLSSSGAFSVWPEAREDDGEGGFVLGGIILLSIFLWLECAPMGLTARETGKYYLTLCQQEKGHRCQCHYKLEVYLQFSDF